MGGWLGGYVCVGVAGGAKVGEEQNHWAPGMFACIHAYIM